MTKGFLAFLVGVAAIVAVVFFVGRNDDEPGDVAEVDVFASPSGTGGTAAPDGLNGSGEVEDPATSSTTASEPAPPVAEPLESETSADASDEASMPEVAADPEPTQAENALTAEPADTAPVLEPDPDQVTADEAEAAVPATDATEPGMETADAPATDLTPTDEPIAQPADDAIADEPQVEVAISDVESPVTPEASEAQESATVPAISDIDLAIADVQDAIGQSTDAAAVAADVAGAAVADTVATAGRTAAAVELAEVAAAVEAAASQAATDTARVIGGAVQTSVAATSGPYIPPLAVTPEFVGELAEVAAAVEAAANLAVGDSALIIGDAVETSIAATSGPYVPPLVVAPEFAGELAEVAAAVQAAADQAVTGAALAIGDAVETSVDAASGPYVPPLVVAPEFTGELAEVAAAVQAAADEAVVSAAQVLGDAVETSVDAASGPYVEPEGVASETATPDQGVAAEAPIGDTAMLETPSGLSETAAIPAAEDAADGPEVASADPSGPAPDVAVDADADQALPERSVGPDQPDLPGAPTFDVIRVGGDGRLVLAGKSEPLAEIIIADGDQVLGEETASLRGEWVFMPTDALSPGSHQLGATYRMPNGTLVPSSDQVLVVVPERGLDIAGRDNDRADQPLVMLVPRDGGPATVVVQSPEPDQPLDSGLDGTEVAAAEDAEPDVRPSGDIFSRPAAPGAETDAASDPVTRTTGDSGADAVESATGSEETVGDVVLAQPAEAAEPTFDTPANSGGDVASAEEGAGVDGAPVTLSRPADAPADAAGATGDVSLDVIDYDQQGEISFAGDAPAGSMVQVYLDNAALGVTEAAASGAWQLAPTQTVPPGQHQIRVDQIAPTGDVIARIELPFVRAEAIDALPEDAFVVVQPGQSLWRIARVVYGEGIRYTEILAANRAQIADPNMIYPGQVFMIPRT